MRLDLPRLSVLAALLIVAGAASPVAARQTLKLAPVPDSRMWVDGTSNRSDWTVEAKDLSGSFVMDGTTVGSASIDVPAERIESAISRIMDRLMYKTLKSARHATVTFRTVGAMAMVAGADGGYSTTVRGELAIAGVTREVSFPVTAEKVGSDGWRFKGQMSMLLTDFGMEPPTALFGALHTGDQVTIRFDVLARP